MNLALYKRFYGVSPLNIDYGTYISDLNSIANLRRMEAGLSIDLDQPEDVEEPIERLTQQDYIAKIMSGELKPDVQGLTTPKPAVVAKLTPEQRKAEEEHIRMMFDKQQRIKEINSALRSKI